MRKLLNEMMGVSDNDMTDVPVEQGAPTEITPELMANLVEQMPELADIDQGELEKGLQIEMGEHYDSVGGDMLVIAKIAADHIKETPQGKSYYDALAAMEHELQETPGEEEAEHLPGGEEAEIETPVGDLPMESKDGISGKLNENEDKPVEETPAEKKEEPAKETATNEEAQEMVEKGEAEIPAEAAVSEEEATKE